MAEERLSTRAMRQYLGDLARAGIDRLPRVEEAGFESSPAATSKAVPQPNTVAEPQADVATRPPGSIQDPATPTPNETLPVTDAIPENGSPADRLCAMADRVAACTRCRELADTRNRTVFGVGDPNARILFLGEAPGADEDQQGEPFVGRAGQLLNRIIAACNLQREEIYICNVLKCRPPGNRNPSTDEATNCREYLDFQLVTVDPEYIVCWGSVAAQNLLETKQSIGKLRKRFHEHGRAKVLCTYHPSYLLRNPAAKKDVWEDMQFLFRDMGIELKASS